VSKPPRRPTAHHLQPDTPPHSRTQYYLPMSEHLHVTLREPLRDILPDNASYNRRFDQFEYLRGIVHVAQRKQHYRDYPGDEGHGPLGRFGPRLGYEEVQSALAEVEAYMTDLTVLWADLFDVPVGQLDEAQQAYDSYVSQVRWRRF
jgi:hypothetical protein